MHKLVPPLDDTKDHVEQLMCILEGARSKGRRFACHALDLSLLSLKEEGLLDPHYSGLTAIVGPNRWHRNWHRTGLDEAGPPIRLYNVTWAVTLARKIGRNATALMGIYCPSPRSTLLPCRLRSSGAWSGDCGGRRPET